MAMVLAAIISTAVVVTAAAVFLVAGWLVIYLVARRALERKVARLSRDLEAELLSLRRLVREISPDGAVAPASRQAEAKTALAVPKPEVGKAFTSTARPDEEISEEVVLVITAAVTAYLGKKVRIRSAKRLQTPYEIVNPWAQQGRVFVQASHNVAQRGH